MNIVFLVKRFAHALVTMLIVATAVFLLFRVIPGDPAAMTLGIDASAEAREALRETMGLNQPILVQYWTWLSGLFRGDLGTAFTQGNIAVTDLIIGPLIRTLELAVVATVIALVIAVPLGILSATRSGTWVDQATRIFAMTGFSLPSFWLGIILILVFSQHLRLLPSGGYESFAESPIEYLRHIAMPAGTVGFIMSGIFLRFIRASMVEVLNEDYIRTARAKGAGERRVEYLHALRNALISFVTVVGMQFGLLLGGMVVVEVVFAWPGLGWLLVQTVQARDFNVVQAGVLLAAGTFVLVNTLVDILYTWLDPRIEYAAGRN